MLTNGNIIQILCVYCLEDTLTVCILERKNSLKAKEMSVGKTEELIWDISKWK
jgi:hypothetical protein